jgi:hypothetical protein
MKIITSEMITEVDTLVQLLYAKDYDNPKISSKSGILILGNTFNPLMITYENLKSSGDLKLFDDLNLRNAIAEPYETFNQIQWTEDVDRGGVEIYYENFLLPNVSFWNMTKTSKSYAQETYFQNMVLARSVSLRQIKEAYIESIESLKKLKITFAELENDN